MKKVGILVLTCLMSISVSTTIIANTPDYLKPVSNNKVSTTLNTARTIITKEFEVISKVCINERSVCIVCGDGPCSGGTTHFHRLVRTYQYTLSNGEVLVYDNDFMEYNVGDKIERPYKQLCEVVKKECIEEKTQCMQCNQNPCTAWPPHFQRLVRTYRYTLSNGETLIYDDTDLEYTIGDLIERPLK